jgi:hypothetical protein
MQNFIDTDNYEQKQINRACLSIYTDQVGIIPVIPNICSQEVLIANLGYTAGHLEVSLSHHMDARIIPSNKPKPPH